MRLVAEQAPPEQVVQMDLKQFGEAPGIPKDAVATVAEMRVNLDIMLNDLTTRVRDGNVARIMADPFPDPMMKVAFLMGRKLVDDLKPKTN